MIFLFHPTRRCLAERKTYTHSPWELLVIESGFYYIQLCETVVHEVSHLEILTLVVYIYLKSHEGKEHAFPSLNNQK
jgi:hypothetical protein